MPCLRDLSLAGAAVSAKLQRGATPPAMSSWFPQPPPPAPGPCWPTTPGFNRPTFPLSHPAARPVRSCPSPGRRRPARYAIACTKATSGLPGRQPDWDRFAIYRQCLQELGESRALIAASRQQGRAKPSPSSENRPAAGVIAAAPVARPGGKAPGARPRQAPASSSPPAPG